MRTAPIVAWVAFVSLVCGSSPAHFWLDAGQIAAAGAELGVIHPPGAPGFVPLLHVATALPLGSLGFRMTLVSSALGALTIGLAASILARRQAHLTTIVGTALMLLGALTFARHARTLEIYTYGACLAMVAVWAFDPAVPHRKRVSYRLLGTMAAACGAFGFGDLRLLVVFGLGLWWLRAWWVRAPWARWAPLAVAAATLPVLTLLLSASMVPVANWGDPFTMDRLWAHLQAESIRHAYADEILPTTWGPWLLHLDANLERIVEDVGPLAVVVWLGAFVGRRRPSADRRLAWLLLLIASVELFYAVGINPMGGRDRQTGLLLAVVVTVLVGLAAHAWLPPRPPVRWAVAPMFWLAVAGPGWLVSWPEIVHAGSWGPHAWTRDALSQAPPRALVLTQSDDLSGGLLAATVLEGARPDLSIVVAQHLDRSVPRHLDAQAPLAIAWAHAEGGRSEAERINRMIEVWPGPVASEYAYTEVLARLPRVDDLTLGVPLTILRAPVRWPSMSVDTWIETQRHRQWTIDDRTRLGVALSSYARAWLRTHPQEPRAYAEAERVLTVVVRDLVPAHPSALVALGGVYDRLGRTERAIEVTRAALAVEPDRAVALTNLALYLSRDLATVDEARELAERAVYLRPHLRSAWRRLAQVARTQGDLSRAEQAEAQLGGLTRDDE